MYPLPEITILEYGILFTNHSSVVGSEKGSWLSLRIILEFFTEIE
jgi:hypothetical protein